MFLFKIHNDQATDEVFPELIGSEDAWMLFSLIEVQDHESCDCVTGTLEHQRVSFYHLFKFIVLPNVSKVFRALLYIGGVIYNIIMTLLSTISTNFLKPLAAFAAHRLPAEPMARTPSLRSLRCVWSIFLLGAEGSFQIWAWQVTKSFVF